MRAVVYDAFRAPPEVRGDVPDPTPAPHGAVVRIEATGLCRSDWHGWMGHDDDIATFPHIPGHELAGVIEEVGADVTRLRPGDRVTVPFVCACGSCEQCANGDHQVCDNQQQPGFSRPGSFAEYTALDWADVNLVPLPESIGFDAAASLGCRFATAYRAVLQVGRTQPGEWVAVHGAGGVGLSAVMIAKATGAQVVAIDPSPEARALAVAHGADEAAEPGTDICDLTGGAGAHVSLDAIGNADAAAASIAGLRKRGRHVQVGLLPEPPRLPMHLVIARELEILGSHGMAAHAYPEMLALVESGVLRPGDLVTTRIALDDAPAALTALGSESPRGVTVIQP
jgi:alcohol dehydrogenase